MHPIAVGGPWSARACALLLLCTSACGTPEFDTSRPPPPPITLGEAFFGVLCDRMGALLLPEDFTGASFRGLCHRGAEGSFAEGVDAALLPGLQEDAVDAQGQPVSLDTQAARRAEALARLATLGQHRLQMVAALDALFPEESAPGTASLAPAGSTSTCGPSAPDPTQPHAELAALLGRMAALYGESTLPDSTRATGTWLEALAGSPEFTQGLAELRARRGEAPSGRTLEALRTLLTSPGLRDVLDASTRALAPQAEGPVRPAFAALQEVLHHTLRTAEPETRPAPLRSVPDALAHRDVLSRPRSPLEALSSLLLTEVGPGAAGTPVLVSRRDERGVPGVTALVPPFVDADADGLPDVDGLGRLVSGTSTPVPLVFSVPGVPEGVVRDAEGRALSGPGGTPLYTEVDARRTLLAQLLTEVRPLLATDSAHPRSAVMELLDGLPELLGPRDGAKSSTHVYPPVTVAYDAFHADQAPMMEGVHVGTQVLGQPITDDALEVLRALVADHPGDVARLVSVMRAALRAVDAHPEASLKAGNTLRDDLVDVGVELSREPGMLEDLLVALASPDTQALGPLFVSFLEDRDRFSYDRNALNGPPRNLSSADGSAPHTPVDRTQPDAGLNRSLFQRMLNLMHDANGVAFCNKAGAVVHARGVPIAGTIDLPLFGALYKECEVFKVDNMAVLYLQSIVGKARLYMRPAVMREGVLGIGASTVGVMEQSSGLTGFWTTSDSRDFRPQPAWLDRMIAFDLANDSPTPGGKNYVTQHFLNDLQGANIGSAVCPERVIPDPDPMALDASPDGKVHGLRACADSDWFTRRNPDTVMMMETEGFLKAFRPVLSVFTDRNREDLFIRLMEVLYRHWPSERAPASECGSCSRAGAVNLEPLLAETMGGDAQASLQAVVTRLQALQVSHCTAVDPTTRACTHAEAWSGVKVLAELVRMLIDPARAQTMGLTDRHGVATHVRQDGVTRAQVTPLSLGLDALDHGGLGGPVLTRLADQFLAVKGERETAAFADPLVERLLPVALGQLRSELYSRCPNSWTPPYARCTWMRDEVEPWVQDQLGGPLVATAWDFLDAARRDDSLRLQSGAMTESLLDPASEGWPALLGTAADGVQLLAARDGRRVALAHLLADTLVPDGLVDQSLALGHLVVGKQFTEEGQRICAGEVDPDGVIPEVLGRLVTPVSLAGEDSPRTPLEVLVETLVDVERQVPGSAEVCSAEDYQRIGQELSAFLLDPDHGLERFYAVASKAGGAP